MNSQGILNFVEGIRAYLVQNEPKATDPLEQLLTEVFGRRNIIQKRLPSASEMWDEYIQEAMSMSPQRNATIQTWYKNCERDFPVFAHKKYTRCLHQPWNDISRIVVLGLMKQGASDEEAWGNLLLRFGIGAGRSMSFDEIGKMVRRDPSVIQMTTNRAIAAIRSSPNVDAMRIIAGRQLMVS